MTALVDRAPYVSPTTSSIVPHFSSSIAPHVPYVASSTIAALGASKIESIPAPTSSNGNIQDLIDQLRTCINMLSLLLQNQIEQENLLVPNRKSHAQQKRISNEELSQSSSDHSKRSIPHKENLIFEDITVRRCNSPIDQLPESIIVFSQKKHTHKDFALFQNIKVAYHLHTLIITRN